VELPAKCTILVSEEAKIKNPVRRAREWCGSLVGAMVWLSSIIPSSTYVFRGHSNGDWELQSSLWRKKQPKTLKVLLEAETAILQQVARDNWFRKEFGFPPASRVNVASYERTVAVLQHHHIPTRLLDATTDPLVALYFAVVGESNAADMDDVDGELIFVRKVDASDGLPIHIVPAPQISERVTAQRACFIAPTSAKKSNNSTAPDAVAVDFTKVDATNGSLTNFDRLVKKFLAGEFSGRPPAQAPNFLSFEIPHHLKPACREVLKSLGISARNLFPGSEGYQRDLSGF
jgi:hypothetical protein